MSTPPPGQAKMAMSGAAQPLLSPCGNGAQAMQGLQGTGNPDEQVLAPASGRIFVQSRLEPLVPPLPEGAPSTPELLALFEPDSSSGVCCPQPIAISKRSVTHRPERFFISCMDCRNAIVRPGFRACNRSILLFTNRDLVNGVGRVANPDARRTSLPVAQH